MDSLLNFLRHLETTVKIKAARIFTSIGKHNKFNKEEQSYLKWVLMQMTQILSDSGDDFNQVAEICGVIRTISKGCRVKRDTKNL